ncbi:MAG: transglutaminase-like domain-containing protein [Myxococcota bacterium]
MEPLPESLAWRQFLDLVAQNDDALPLDLGALLIAAQAQPELEVQRWMAKLDAMAEHIRAPIPDSAPSDERFEALRIYIHRTVGLSGNVDDYYALQNSYLNRVIERGLGIPITISVVYLELARRIGVPLRGIGFPGHFLIEHTDTPEGYVDPFDPTELLDTDDLAAMLHRASQGQARLEAEHLMPVSNREILTRMLVNLKLIHLRRAEPLHAIRMIDGILALDAQRAVEYRDRGRIYAEIEYDGQAEDDLSTYLALRPDATDAPELRELLATVQERLSHYH